MHTLKNVPKYWYYVQTRTVGKEWHAVISQNIMRIARLKKFLASMLALAARREQLET